MSYSSFTPEQQDEISRMIQAASNPHGTLIRQLQGSVPADSVLASTGDVKATLASAAPAGWLLLDGSTKNTADYPDLASVLGAVGGTFVLPDCRGRALIGAGTGTGLTARTLNATGGTEKLVLSELPAHDHGGVTGSPSVSLNHSHTPSNGSQFVANGVGAGANITFGGGGYVVLNSTNSVDLSHTHTISSAGSGDNDSKMQPWIAVNWIVKA